MRTNPTLLLVTSLSVAGITIPLEAAEEPLDVILRGADELLKLGDPAEGDPIEWRATWRDASACRPLGESPQIEFAQGLPGGCAAPSALFQAVGEAPEGDMPTSAAYSLDGSTFILANRDSSNLVLFDAHTREYLRSIEISGSPQAIALHPVVLVH